MTLSDISIKNPVFAWMLMAGLILFGVISYSRMGLSQMPDVDFPVVNIDITYEGASPEILETDVVDVVEDAVMSVEGIREVRSVAKRGRASITVELNVDRNVDFALQEIQSKIAQAQKLLPREIDPPILSKSNPEDLPIMYIAVTSDKPLKEMMTYTKYHLRDKFQTVQGVADVSMGGYVDRNMRIWVDRSRLNSYELSVDDIMNTIIKEHVEVPGGKLDLKQNELLIRSFGEASSVEQVKNLPITFRGGLPVYRRIFIKDVAEVEDGLDDVTRIARFNGKQSVGLGIIKQRKTDAVAISKRINEKLVHIKADLPKGYEINISNDTTRFIKESTDELLFNIFLSTILTSIVCLLFLGSFSSTFNILLAIPTSIMASFIPMYFSGFTLNTFTLLALSLAIGIVVDDAIMVLENITRYYEKGDNRIVASQKGARQITFAAVAATLSIIAIFLPVAFMKGIIGKFFLEFGVAISVAVGFSLLEALTLTPMRASQFLAEEKKKHKALHLINSVFSSLAEGYRKTLEFALNHRLIMVGSAIIIFILSLFLLVPLKKEFVPSQDQSMLVARIKTPAGSSLEYTDNLSKKAEQFVFSRKETLRYFAVAGGIGGGDSNSGFIFITMKPLKERPINPQTKKYITQGEFAIILRQELNKISKDLKVSIQDLSMRGFSATRGYPVEIIVKGDDWDKLGSNTIKIVNEMRKSGKLVDVDTSYDLGQPELQIYPNRVAAELRGVSMASIGTTISAMMGGQRAGKFTDSGHRFDIRVRLKENERLTPEDVYKLYVRNNRGELVRLSDVVTIKKQNTLLSITRLNRERAINIYANPAPGVSQQEAIEQALAISKKVLPEGYTSEITGTAKTSAESFQSLLFALVIGVIVAYMILASQYNSYLDPVIILLSLPFSFTGAVFALVITGNTLNLYSFIGLILLMGLVKKNAILLVEFTNQMRETGLSVRDALLKACPIRLRPILMTSLATIAAAIPPAMAFGPGAEARIPMAVCVLGGMIFSTILTLYVIPCAYSLATKIERKKYHVQLPEDAPQKKVRKAKTGDDL